MIELKNIKKSYYLEDKEIPIIQDVNVTINDGDLVAIIGPSGSGKSTLMNIIGLLDRPTAGEYFLDGKKMGQISDSEQSYIRGRKIGFVFQNYSLIPRMDVIHQVMLPLAYHGVGMWERRTRAEEALQRVWLGEHLLKRPEQLSGGQKQRVAIARALVTKPSLILADEPTGALDSKTGDEVIRLFQELNRDGTTVIVITHSPEIAENCTYNVHIRDGRVSEKLKTKHKHP